MLSREYPSGHIPDEKLIADLCTLATELGREPNTQDIHARWPNRQVKYARRFGSLKNALKAAGLEFPPSIKNEKERPGKKANPQNRHLYIKRNPIDSPNFPANKGKTKYTNEQLLNELHHVANLLGHTPTDAEFRKHGNCSTAPYWKQFGSWAKACILAGLEPHTTFEGGYFKTKPYEYTRTDGKALRLNGTYEYRFAKVLDSLSLDWLGHGEYPPFEYLGADSNAHRYLPDFFIKDWNLYIEIKGWYREKDKIKMRYVCASNPTVTFIVIGKEALETFERTHRLPLL